MFEQSIDLAKARILLSNDDGIGAPGLEVLERVAKTLSDDVWVVAPEQEQSGAGHSLTLRRPLRIRQLGPKRFAVDGTPTDCVLLAVNKIMRDARPTLVLSGVNRGGNMGEDMTYSGTVAAAMEGTQLDVPSIALSLHIANGGEPKWATAEQHAPEVIRRLVASPWPYNTLINVNFPDVEAADVAGIEVGRQGRRKLGDNLVEAIDPRGQPYYWIGPMRDIDATRPGTDIAVVNAGKISVTPVFLDLTHVAALESLRRVFP
ncbi:MAG TPA: 5'/3'-nucleotidase SurE [Stellaceae bacterium]|nr:5'/3'-nucleotidase SurE [Stellaceae bacterium]